MGAFLLQVERNKMRKYENVDINKLIPYTNNARTHSDEQVQKIANSIKEFGFVNPVIVDGEYGIIAGHGRVMGAKLLGMTEVPCLFVEDLSETQKRAYILADNKLALDAGWDDEILKFELQDLNMDFDLEEIGIDFDLDISIDTTDKEVEEDDFEVELPEEPKAKYGDIYQLGNHRLMCGDSTNADDVAKLMNGNKADMIFTDPPYGVNYTDKNKMLNELDGAQRNTKTIENDTKKPKEMYEFWSKAFNNLYDFSTTKTSYYVTAPQGGDLLLLLQALRDNGFALKHQLIWNKNNHVLGRCDYNYKHEPIIYGWKLDGTHVFYGNGNCKTSVWDIDRPLKNDLHPTMKPIQLVEEALNNSSKQNDIILDLFGGSGSTLIACEELNRNCYMMEYEPQYIDVIINRWEQYTGEKAVKL